MSQSEAEMFCELYVRLFNRVTDVMLELQDAQKETEEMFLSFEEERSGKAGSEST